MIKTHDLDIMMGQDWRHELPPVCLQCGYDLTGCVSDRCPECGIYFSRRELARYINDLKLELRMLRSVNDWVRAGAVMVVSGLVLFLTGWTMGRLWIPLLIPIVRTFAFLLAAPSFFLSLSVLRVFRLPRWSREWITEPIRFDLAIGTGLIAAITIAGVFLLP